MRKGSLLEKERIEPSKPKPKYYCPLCRRNHWYRSKIGINHRLEADFHETKGAVPREKPPVPSLNLHLVLKHKWYDLIESGQKTVEYRDMTPYWINRIIKKHNSNGGNTVIFHKGYTNVTMTFEIRMIVCNTPTEKIEIHLGKRLDGGKLSLKQHHDLAAKNVWVYCPWCPCEKCEAHRRTKKEGDAY